MIAISFGLIILTLPVEYDGLKLVIASLTAVSADIVSKTAPIRMEPWYPHPNNGSAS